MTGILYLIPNTLAALSPDQEGALGLVIPEDVQAITSSLDYFIAENAKTTRAHLKLIASFKPLRKTIQEIQISELNINTEAGALPTLLEPLKEGRNAGLISEAGVPAVADPGANLVRLAHEAGIPVRPLVGPSSLLLAVMASGLNGQSFAFNGYLPTDAALRAKRIKSLEERSRLDKQTQLFIETPYRNAALLDAIANTCQGSTLVSIATDLTLPTETIRTQAAAKWKSDIASGKTENLHKRPTVFLMLAQ